MEHEGLKWRVTARIEERADEMVDRLGALVETETVIGNERPGQEVVIDAFDFFAARNLEGDRRYGDRLLWGRGDVRRAERTRGL